MKTGKGLIELLLRPGVEKNRYILMVKTSDLIELGYGHLTSGNSTYTYVNKTWIKPFVKNKE